MKTDESDKSARLAMWYRDTPLSLEMMKTLEGEVTSECWRYLFGKYTLSEKKKRPEGEPVNETYGRIGEQAHKVEVRQRAKGRGLALYRLFVRPKLGIPNI